MTPLPDEAASALGGVVEPVLGRERFGTHAIEELDRRPRLANVFAQGKGKRGMASVEADEQRTARLRPRGPEPCQLVARQARRLLDEHGLSGA